MVWQKDRSWFGDIGEEQKHRVNQNLDYCPNQEERRIRKEANDVDDGLVDYSDEY